MNWNYVVHYTIKKLIKGAIVYDFILEHDWDLDFDNLLRLHDLSPGKLYTRIIVIYRDIHIILITL